MHVSNINAINFNAGKVRLDKIDSKDLFRLNEIKEIAKNGKLDLSISKSESSKFLPSHDMFTVIASRDISQLPFNTSIAGKSMLEKNVDLTKFSDEIYSTVIRTVKRLDMKIQQITGKSPKLLAFLDDKKK